MKFAKPIIVGVTTLSCLALIHSASNAATTATVNVESLILREEASKSSDVVDGLIKGQVVEVLEELDGWYKVQASDGTIGYVSADYVDIKRDKTEEPAEEQKTEEAPEETPKQEETKVEEPKKETPAQSSKKENIKFEVKEATLEKAAKAYILPLINSNVLKSLNSGTKVTIYDEVNNWYYIQDDEISGWVLKSALGEVVTQSKKEETSKQEETPTNQEQTTSNTETTTEQKEESTEKEISRKEMYVNSSSIYVRKGPGTDYDVVDTLVLNNTVYAIAEVGDWYKVEVDNETGYIAKRLLSEDKQETSTRNADERDASETANVQTNNYDNDVVAFAKSFLGCPYVYGGSGPSSFDCSGFTMYVFNNFGVNLSHSATAQSRVGSYVSKEDLQPGDLVFFKDYQTMDGIGHVGIYIGGGDFIHASSGTGYCVKISTLLSGSYEARYETARRVI